MSQNVITSTQLTNLTPLHRGKVRDISMTSAMSF